MLNFLRLYLLSVLLLCNMVAFGQDFSNFKSLKPLQLYGNVGLRAGTYYHSSGFSTYPSSTYMFMGSPVLNVYGMALPFSFMYSNQQAVFRQPFNQLGISPSYKWVTFHAGFRNLYFHKYSLAGYQMLGAGIELNPGRWKLAFTTGRLNKATKLDTSQSSYFFPTVSFARKGMAGLLRYGKYKGHIAISFVKAIDDSTSVANYADLYNKGYTTITPSENLAIGMSFKLPLVKNVSIEAEGGASILTKDLSTPISLDLTKAARTNKTLDLINKVIHINVTSNYFTAVETRLNYQNDKGFNSFLEFKRVDPNYTSMGAYFFQSDVQSYLWGWGIPFFKQKCRFSGTIGKQSDNINQIKLATSTRWVGSGNVNFSSRKLGLDLNFYNYSNNQTSTVKRFADSLRVTQDNLSISLSPRYMIDGANASHTITMTLAANTVNDFNQGLLPEQQKRKLATKTGTLYYQVYFLQKGLSMSSSFNFTQLSDMQSYRYDSYGYNLSCRKSLFARKLELSLSGGVYATDRATGRSNNFTGTFNSNYFITNKLRLDVNIMYNNAPSVYGLSGSGYDTEFRTDTNLIYNF